VIEGPPGTQTERILKENPLRPIKGARGKQWFNSFKHHMAQSNLVLDFITCFLFRSPTYIQYS
jgi:hypothetical protein